MTTAIFASSGLPFFVFLGAAICSLPRQLSDVLLGVLLAEESIDGTSKKEKLATIAVFGVTILITSFTIKFLNREMDKVRPQVIYERRKARYVFIVFFARHEADVSEQILVKSSFKRLVQVAIAIAFTHLEIAPNL